MSSEYAKDSLAVEQWLHSVTDEQIDRTLPGGQLANLTTEGDDVMLRIFVGEDGNALARMERAPDGEVRMWIGDVEEPHRPLLPQEDWRALTIDMQNRYRTDIARMAALDLGETTVMNALLGQHQVDVKQGHNRISELIGRTARAAARRRWRGISVNGEQREADYGRAHGAINALIRRHIVSQRNIKTAERLMHPMRAQQVTAACLNFVIKNERTMEKVLRVTPSVLRYYVDQMVLENRRRGGQTPELRAEMIGRDIGSPAQLVSAVREATGLTDAQWRMLCRMPPVKLERLGDNANENLRTSLEIICRINPGTDERWEQRENVMVSRWASDMATRMEEARAHYSHGDPLELWIDLARRCMRHPMQGSLERMADALSAYVREDRPWHKSGLNVYIRRSREWHDQQVEEAKAARDQQAAAQTWESPLDETTLSGHTFTPITNGAELMATASRLKNCLGSYINSCHQGKRLVFAIWREGVLIGATEMLRKNETESWTAGQCEGRPHARSLPANARRACAELAQMVQVAST